MRHRNFVEIKKKKKKNDNLKTPSIPRADCKFNFILNSVVKKLVYKKGK